MEEFILDGLVNDFVVVTNEELKAYRGMFENEKVLLSALSQLMISNHTVQSFLQFDRDNDSLFSAEEVYNCETFLTKERGVKEPSYTKEKDKKVVALYDEDKDGKLSYWEFLQYTFDTCYLLLPHFKRIYNNRVEKIPNLLYFAGRGRGEQIRLILKYKKIEFDDVRFNYDQWVKLYKEKAEFKQSPALEIEGKYYVQSLSVLRYLGRKHGLYSEDPEIAYEVDSLMDGIEDTLSNYYKFKYSKHTNTTNDRERMFQWMKLLLSVVDHRLSNNKKTDYLVRNKLSIADFSFLAFLRNTLMAKENEELFKEIDLTAYPKVKEYKLKKEQEFKEIFDSLP